jgi:NADPH-dependent 2,4-dienoyl-CoA reductase/sulfur reductase-like enzyme
VFAGDRVFPNIRATVQELHDGLNARPQNCWPSLRWDLLALNDLMHPFLGAGFYYKTFMWPRAWWERVYEPLIRRAAGLGRLSGKDDQVPHDKALCPLRRSCDRGGAGRADRGGGRRPKPGPM